MPIDTSCPECHAKYRVPDTAAGKKVKCRTCEFVFPIPKPEPEPEAEPDPWDLEDDPDLTPPLLKKSSRAGGLPPVVGKKMKPAKSTFVSDDDDDDDKPAPKKKRKKKKRSETNPAMLYLGIALGVFAVAFIVGLFHPGAMLWIGVIAMAVGGMWQLGLAFEEDTMTGILHMRMPFYSFYFAITRISETWPAVVMQVLGLLVCVGSLFFSVRHDVARALARNADPLKAAVEDAEADSPEHTPFIKAASPFIEAVANRKYDAAFNELAAVARENACTEQFIPPQDGQPKRTPLPALTVESFKEQMTAMEKALGEPKKLEDVFVVTHDKEVLAGRGDQFEAMLAVGGVPEAIPAASRRASLRVQIQTKPTDPNFVPEEDEVPYLNLKILLIEEEGKLRVGYFEFLGPSILD